MIPVCSYTTLRHSSASHGEGGKKKKKKRANRPLEQYVYFMLILSNCYNHSGILASSPLLSCVYHTADVDVESLCYEENLAAAEVQ